MDLAHYFSIPKFCKFSTPRSPKTKKTSKLEHQKACKFYRLRASGNDKIVRSHEQDETGHGQPTHEPVRQFSIAACSASISCLNWRCTLSISWSKKLRAASMLLMNLLRTSCTALSWELRATSTSLSCIANFLHKDPILLINWLFESLTPSVS